jgi:hypothetical protein
MPPRTRKRPRRCREARAQPDGAEGCRRSFGEYPLIKDFCYKVKWQFGGIQAQEGRRGFPRAAFPAANTPGRAKPPSARLRKSHIFAAVAPVPTDRAGSGPAVSCRTQLSRIPTYKRLLLQAQGFLHADLQTQHIHSVVTKNLHHTRCAGPLPGPSSSASGVERPSAAASQQNALPAKGLAYKSACMDYPDRRKHGQRRRSEPDHRRIGHVNSHSIRAAE